MSDGPIVLHINPSEPIAQEWMRGRIEYLTTCLRGLVDAITWDSDAVQTELRRAREILAQGGDR